MDASQLKEIEKMCGRNLELQAAMIDHLEEILSREPKKLAKIKNPLRYAGALARRDVSRVYMPCGFISFDDEKEGMPLAETIAAVEQEQPTAWRLARYDAAFESLLDILREENATEILAEKLGVTQRRAQQIVKKMVDAATTGDQLSLLGV